MQHRWTDGAAPPSLVRHLADDHTVALKDPDLRSAATKMLPVVQCDLPMMRQINWKS